MSLEARLQRIERRLAERSKPKAVLTYSDPLFFATHTLKFAPDLWQEKCSPGLASGCFSTAVGKAEKVRPRQSWLCIGRTISREVLFCWCLPLSVNLLNFSRR
jgi:hypothetical protein